MLEGFEARTVGAGDQAVFIRCGGRGPPLLLLHGFPQTHLMWRDIAPVLAEDFTLIVADLPGYGRSGCPGSAPDHSPYSKRAMAAELHGLMRQLGFDRFAVAGHDRGGRTAYRMALDLPRVVTKLAVLDIVPTSAAWDRADDRFALAFWPWSLLAQPEPLPERLCAADPAALVDNALSQWGSQAGAFPAEVRADYIRSLSDPRRAHAICEEYRAAATLDREHDAADLAAGRRIECPVLALWSADGALDTWYGDEGGPLALWRLWARDVRGEAVQGGHFFPETRAAETAAALAEFFRDRSG